MAVLYSLVGLIHWRYGRVFALISSRPDEAFRQKRRVKSWDLIFYLTFGLVVTSSVQIAGVLLVFSFLIVPAVVSILFYDKFLHRLIMGWSIGALTSVIGVFLSYFFDLPTGATVVVTFGGMLFFVIAVRRLFAK